ncbi:MAG: DUF3192 domain-containing protein [Candidatus Omnitrophota bacterium]
MRKPVFLLVLAVLLSGCATMTVSRLTANNRMSLVHLSRGMSKPRVLAIMGSGISVYKCDQAVSKSPLKVTINDPYRTEMIEASGRRLEVIYYVTGLNNNNCAVEESGLTPLVFEDDKLIGWGRNFLLEVAPKQEEPQARQTEETQDSQQLRQSVPEPAKQTVQEPAQKTAESKLPQETSQAK